jgi:hypothetical protein
VEKAKLGRGSGSDRDAIGGGAAAMIGNDKIEVSDETFSSIRGDRVVQPLVDAKDCVAELLSRAWHHDSDGVGSMYCQKWCWAVSIDMKVNIITSAGCFSIK